MSLSNLEYKMQACEQPALLQKYQNKNCKKDVFQNVAPISFSVFLKKK